MAIAKNRSMQFVLLMGCVSLWADMTYEGGRSLAGPYLAALGASGTAVGFIAGFEAVGALIFGRIFDRMGSGRTLVLATLFSTFFAPLVFKGGFAVALAGMALWGIGMGAQGSVMKAMVAELVSKDRRASAYGIFNAGYGVDWFAGSALIGWLYDRFLTSVIAFSMTAQVLSVPLLLKIRRP